MDLAQVTSFVVAGAAVLGSILAYFKYKPGQRDAVDMNIAQANMNVAQGTFQLVTGELEEQFKRMSATQRELEERLREADVLLTKVGRELAIVEVKLVKAQDLLELITGERDRLREENASLRKQVASLEAEVYVLKNGRTA